VITDRELDDQLAAAAGIRDADLPALPEDFLGRIKAEAETTRSEPASVIAARQLVSDAHDRRSRMRPRRRNRAVVVRIGAAVLAVAAAWTTAVVVTGPGTDRTRTATPPTSSVPTSTPTDGLLDPPGGLSLVAAQAVTFPYSLDPEPRGLTPELMLAGGLERFGVVDPVVWSADYRSADDPGFSFWISSADPREAPGVQHPQDAHVDDDILGTGTVPVSGTEADFVRGQYAHPLCRYASSISLNAEPHQVCSDSFAELFWQRPDGLWVYLSGDGRYSEVSALVSVAESIVDRPQPVPLQVRLAPEGWVVSGYEAGGLSLVDAAHATSASDRLSISLLERWRGYTEPDDVLKGMTDGEPVEHVTVNGRPAALVSVPDHVADPGENRHTWYLGAQFAHGPLFLFQAPDSLSREDVLAMAEQATYTP
jgi:hypothetical protein